MKVAFLAFLAAAAAQPGPEVSTLVVNAPPKGAPHADATVNIGSDRDALNSQAVSIWPADAKESGQGGYVTLSCLVDVHGLAETCRVIFETPPGRGFGKAALALRPTLKLTPKQGPGGPEDAMMNVAVSFNAKESRSNVTDVMKRASGLGAAPPEDGGAAERGGGPHEINARDLVVYDNPIQMRRITMMDSRAWVQAPGFEDLAAAYPAQGGGAEGYAVAHCKVLSSGELSRCVVVKELPAAHGFGRAAVGLAARFRVSPDALASAPHGAPIEVDVPVRFPPPAQAGDRLVRAPVWIAGSDPQSLLRELPAAVVKRPTTPGALVKCQVGADGALTGCAVELTSPDGIDYDEAAVKLASRMRMSLWSAEAGPVQGGTIRIAIKPEPQVASGGAP